MGVCKLRYARHGHESIAKILYQALASGGMMSPGFTGYKDLFLPCLTRRGVTGGVALTGLRQAWNPAGAAVFLQAMPCSCSGNDKAGRAT